MQRTLLLMTLLFCDAARADMIWSSIDPDSHGGSAPTAHAGHGRPSGEQIDLLYGDGASAQLWLPTLELQPLPLDHGSARLKPSGMENYHLLLAVRETATSHDTALRYHYLRGKPSGRSPSELVYAEKVPLEIVPVPLPREHNRYLSDTRVAFLLRFQGKPLGHHTVTLETTNGLRSEVISDTRGRLTVELPNDFKRINPGRDRNRPAEFFLRTWHEEAGRLYTTSLSAEYHINPLHWQSQSGALWSGLAGFVSGIGILGFVARRSSRKGVAV